MAWRRCCRYSCSFGGSAARVVVHNTLFRCAAMSGTESRTITTRRSPRLVSVAPAHPSCCGQGTLWAPTLVWFCFTATPGAFDLQASDGTYDAGEVECKAAEELCNKINCSGEPGGLAQALQPNRSLCHCCHSLRLALPSCITKGCPFNRGALPVCAGLTKFSCDPADSTNSKCTCVSAGLASCFPGGRGTKIMRQQVGENTRGVGTHESRNL